MLEVLKFIFSSFWIWIGFVTILAIMGSYLIGVIGAIRGSNVKISVFGDINSDECECDEDGC